MKLENNYLIIFFERVYVISDKKYIPNTTLKISNWSKLDINLYIPEEIFPQQIVVKLSVAEIEYFEFIQETKIAGNNLILAGFSKSSGHWMEYVFSDYCYTLTT